MSELEPLTLKKASLYAAAGALIVGVLTGGSGLLALSADRNVEFADLEQLAQDYRYQDLELTDRDYFWTGARGCRGHSYVKYELEAVSQRGEQVGLVVCSNLVDGPELVSTSYNFDFDKYFESE